jgi:hypothetical protein
MPAPDACEGRVKGELHLILEIQVGSRQQGEQVRQIGGKLCPQISFDERPGEQRFRCCGPCSYHLDPQSFPRRPLSLRHGARIIQVGCEASIAMRM